MIDDQLDEALKILNDIVAAEPQDAQSQIHIAEIQRRQGHYDDALATLKKAKPLGSPTRSSSPTTKRSSTTPSAATTKPPTYSQDSSAAPPTRTASTPIPRRPTAPSSSTASPIIYREQNKTTEAVAAYKKMIEPRRRLRQGRLSG